MTINYGLLSKPPSTNMRRRPSSARASILQEVVHITVPLLVGFYSVVLFIQNLSSNLSLRDIEPSPATSSTAE